MDGVKDSLSGLLVVRGSMGEETSMRDQWWSVGVMGFGIGVVVVVVVAVLLGWSQEGGRTSWQYARLRMPMSMLMML